jgi:two-component system CheB/CheR fusion protein
VAQDLIVVGLGASAGGIGALKRFFDHMPSDSGMAFVAILHLSPEHDSHLAEVLQGSTAMPVTQVADRTQVQANHVYVVPPSRSLQMADGHLTLSEINHIEERRAPVDVFFRTLGATHQARAVGIVLSGTGADGSMGLKLIKESGGLCFAQDPAEAEFADMPRNSIATGIVDHVLPVAEIPARILSLAKHVHLMSVPEEPVPPVVPDEQALREVLSDLRLRTGHDFSNYKRPTLMRRLGRRLAVHDLVDLAAYAELVRQRPEELQALLKDLLISVTHFFRDRDAFRILETRVVPELFRTKESGDQVRVWVAGCATGEEAYSIAMLLVEHALSFQSPPAVQVFATDIDGASLALARQGLYTLNDAADVPPERLQRFFTKEGTSYRVRPELRETILFSQHNLIKDPPFSHLDLVSCRNLLIYLNRTAQRRAMEVIHFSLGLGRFLFLGPAESIEVANDLFAPYEKDACLFHSRQVSMRTGLPVPRSSGTYGFEALHHHSRPPAVPAERRVAADVHQRLLEQYAPPSVVVNSDHDILHVSATAGQFLAVPAGDPSHNLLKAVREELQLELRGALYQAAQDRAQVETRAVAVRLAEGVVPIQVLVRPAMDAGHEEVSAFLVLFRRATDAAEGPAATPAVLAEPLRHRDDEIARLQLQLRASLERADVQAEEHRAAIEEQQAMYEELRSSSEELETSREELQSLNEELRTVNQELRIKVDEQLRVNDDMQNLVNATEIGTIFLDRGLRLKFFTPSVRTLFNFIPADRGRPFSDINTVLAAGAGDLQQDVERVIGTLARVEREIPTRDGRWALMRAYPYRTADDRIDGVVLTFVDVTERRRAADLIRLSEERLRRAVDVDNVAVSFFTIDGHITHANDTFLSLVGAARGLLDHGTLRYQGTTAAASAAAVARAHSELRANGRTSPYEREYVQPDGTRRWTLSAATRLMADECVEFSVDITRTKHAEDQLLRSQARLRLMVESVAEYAILSMDPQGCIDHWNPGAARIFGYEDAEIVGQSFGRLFTSEDRAAGVDREELRQAREHGTASDERWHVRKDGSRFFMSGVTAPLRSEGGLLTGYVKVARDLTDRKKAEDALHTSNNALESRVQERTAELAATNRTLQAEAAEHQRAEERVREVMTRMMSIQEDERRRIARDLHDQVGQEIVALKLTLEAIDQAGAPAGVRDRVNTARDIAARLDRDVDVFTSELRPLTLDDFGLVPAIDQLVAEWGHTTGVEAQVHSGGFDERRLSRLIETCLYRVAQEALTNIAKHAHATIVSVVLERTDGMVRLVIADDGRGFDNTHSGSLAGRSIGLRGMQERVAAVGGTFTVESAPREGTTVTVRVPAAEDVNTPD